MKFLKKLKSKLLPKPYFFVIGAGRGGTSLLAGMLDYNPELTIGFERFAFDYLLGEKLEQPAQSSLQERLQNFKNACQTEANRHTNLWGNKITTEQIAALGECSGADWPGYFKRFAEDVLQNKKVVFILRDGRTCVDSKLRRTNQPYELAVARWKTCVQMLQYLQQNHPKLYVLTYEELLQQPEDELRKVCAFLGVTYHPAMLGGTANPNMPEMYRGDSLRNPVHGREFPQQWTDDMRQELIATGYLSATS